MKKSYFNLFLVFIFGLLSNLDSYGQIVANPDQGNVTYSNSVQIAIQNVLGNDTLNSIPTTLSTVTITQISASSNNVSIQANGNAVVEANTPSGFYEVTYQICDNANPNTCDFTTAFITVNPIPPTPIVANNDTVIISEGSTAQIVLENVLSNDTLGGIPVSISDVTIFSISSTGGFFNVDPSNGSLLQMAQAPPGVYELSYYICQNGAPNNCDVGFITVTVLNSLSTTITGTYQDLNGDGVTNVGDVINYIFSITNTSTSPITNILISSNEVNINGTLIPSLNAGDTDSSTYSGVYVLTQEDINAGNAVVTIQTYGILLGDPLSFSTTHSLNLNIPNGIHLNAFIDYNSNGTQESGEPNFTHGAFQYQLNDNGTVHNIISPNGMHYLYETNTTNSYDFSYAIDPAFASQYTVTPASFSNVTVPNGSGVVTYNFVLTQTPYHDTAVNLFANAMPRPGFIYYNTIYYYNQGNQTIASGTVTFNNGSNVSISTYPPGAVPFAGGFTYNFTNLLPGEYRALTVAMQVPTIPTVNLGDWVTNTVSISQPLNDVNPNNNNMSLTEVIVGSYDPNDKAESHGPQIQHSNFTSNDYLTYTIRFENTGTAEAINVRVDDVLDAHLDETTVRMVAASHAYVLDRVGSNLTWRFDGINLEPSIPGNLITGHGYIVFQVKPKPGYVIGDVIPNSANIYFDFNPAIVTNNWTTEFVTLLGTDHFAFDHFKYYPNPVKNSLTISNDATIERVEITSVLGQKVKSFTANSLQTEIDMNGMANGMYFVKVTSLGQEKTIKIIKD